MKSTQPTWSTCTTSSPTSPLAAPPSRAWPRFDSRWSQSRFDTVALFSAYNCKCTERSKSWRSWDWGWHLAQSLPGAVGVRSRGRQRGTRKWFSRKAANTIFKTGTVIVDPYLDTEPETDSRRPDDGNGLVIESASCLNDEIRSE